MRILKGDTYTMKKSIGIIRITTGLMIIALLVIGCSKEVVEDEPVAEETGPDPRTSLLNTIIDLENELKALRKRVKDETLAVGEDQID